MPTTIRRPQRRYPEGLFVMKPWEYKGRRMERNAPAGTRCTSECSHPRPTPAQALCTVCHEVFSGIWHFDTHRRDGWCLDPATLNLALSEAGVWKRIISDEERQAFRGRLGRQE